MLDNIVLSGIHYLVNSNLYLSLSLASSGIMILLACVLRVGGGVDVGYGGYAFVW